MCVLLMFTNGRPTKSANALPQLRERRLNPTEYTPLAPGGNFVRVKLGIRDSELVIRVCRCDEQAARMVQKVERLSSAEHFGVSRTFWGQTLFPVYWRLIAW